MHKKKGKFTLEEALDLLEATFSHEYPDNGTGIAGGDDLPPSNIILGYKYKRVPYFNKLTDFKDRWDVDSEENWNWEDFENTIGQADMDNYSDTLQSMKDLFPRELWDKVWSRMKNINMKDTHKYLERKFNNKEQEKNQLGKDKESSVEIDAKKNGAQFKDAKLKNENILNRIHQITL